MQQNCWKKKELNQQVVAQEINTGFQEVEEAEVVMEVEVAREESKVEVRAEELKKVNSSNREGGKESSRLRKSL